MLEKLLRKTNIIMHKVNVLEDKVANINEIDGDDDSHKTANINQNFPFADVGKFKEFDQALMMDDQLFKNLVSVLF